MGEHQQKDAARKEAILARGEFKILHAMIDKPGDILAIVLALRTQVPAGCETFSAPRPPASTVQCCNYGHVRIVEAFDPVEGLMIRRADL